MKFLALLLFAGCFLLPANLHAENDPPTKLIVSANRTQQELRQSNSSVILLEREQIENSRLTNVQELLKTLPGLDVVSSGGLGGNTAVFIRGAKAEHTLILIDGIEMNNPVSTGRFYNLANLALGDIERIEIIKGTQSSLYGSDAIGGVISIYTKQAEDSKVRISSQAGSYDTYNQVVNSSWVNENIASSLNFSRLDSHSFSAQNNPISKSEDDSYENTSWSGNFKIKLEKQDNINFIARHSNSNSQIDDGFGENPDDPNHKVKTREYFLRSEAQNYFLDEQLKQTLGFAYSRHKLFDKDDNDYKDSYDFLDSSFYGKLAKFDLVDEYTIDQKNRVIAGAESEKESANSDYISTSEFGDYSESFSDNSIRTNSLFLISNNQITDYLYNEASVRYDKRAGYDDEVTFKIAPAFAPWKDAKIVPSYATGFKAPSLYQLYSIYGSEDLDAEKSKNFELAFRQSLLRNKLDFSISYYKNKIDNLIDFDPQTFQFFNIGEANLSGFETELTYNIDKNWLSHFAYAYLDTEDQNSENLLRRARQRATFGLTHNLNEKLNLYAEYLLVGKRFDTDFNSFPSERIELGSYGLINLRANYKINQDVTSFVRIDNLLDKEYEEVFSYNTAGLAVTGGLQLEF